MVSAYTSMLVISKYIFFLYTISDVVIQNVRQLPTSMNIIWQLVQVAAQIGLPSGEALVARHVLVLDKGTLALPTSSLEWKFHSELHNRLRAKVFTSILYFSGIWRSVKRYIWLRIWTCSRDSLNSHFFQLPKIEDIIACIYGNGPKASCNNAD